MTTQTQMARFSDWFDDSDIEVQFSHYRFVYAGIPAKHADWTAIQREYRQIKAAREAVQS